MSRYSTLLLTGLIILIGISTGCSSEQPLDPAAYPFKLEAYGKYRGKAFPVDLDGDGADEIVAKLENMPAAPKGGHSLEFRTFSDIAIDQNNFDVPLENDPFFIDIDADHVLEILQPVIKQDSLYLVEIEISTNEDDVIKERWYPIASGQSRKKGNELYAWDPEVREIHLVDYKGDGRKELAVVIQTGHALSPRGIFILSLPDFQVLDQWLLGSPPYVSLIHNGVGLNEGDKLILGTYGADNGASLNGFEDTNSYLISLGLDSLSLEWSLLVGPDATGVNIEEGKFIKGRDTDLIYWSPRNPLNTDLQILEIESKEIVRSFPATHSIRGVEVVDLDQNGRLEILLLDASGKLTAFTEGFKAIDERDFPGTGFHLNSFPDIDGDLIKEIAISSGYGTFFLNKSLEIKAYYPNIRNFQPASMINAGDGQPSYIYSVRDDKGETVYYRFVRQPFYLFVRHKVWFLIIAILLLSPISFLIGFTQQKKEIRNSEKELKLSKKQYLDRFLHEGKSEFYINVEHLIENHALADSAFDVSKLEEVLGQLEKKQLNRNLMSAYGISATDLIWRFRAAQAAKLLKESDLSIKEIAYQTGFNDPPALSKKFKSIYTDSPSEYRRKNR